MIRRAIALAVISFALVAAPVAAWDPEDDGWDWWWQPEPAPEPVPAWTPPDPTPDWAPDPVSTWTPEPEPVWTPPEPAPVEAPPGLYYVTETYVADVVTTQGPVTTYSTATVDQSPGTYARVLESVGTGASSGYDGSAFNGRVQLTDGRDVAGTYYENFVLTAAGFESVSIVFFQDDSETARLSAPPASSPPAGTTPPPSAPPIAIVPAAPGVVTAPPVAAAPPAAAPPASVAPPQAAAPAGVSEPGETTSPTAPMPASVSIPAAPTVATPGGPPHVPVLRGGVSPQPQGDLLESIDVLRGRRIALWPRATADGAPARVREWHASGELVALGPLSGSGEEPLVARWDALASPGGSWPVRLALLVDLPGGGTSAIDVVVSVVVRSPALVQ